ncbi:hypothetical protein THRCLA_21353 [Thraustotheca clavata]|uniref:Uncharacterized protein n=1 Tax=Thraustotheca clavata TaxID=74557 RepID=A0A1V9ZXG3_9STRA|nr:hypothetical protein THRCLA_21353 [Thraustotheca clavata]
MKKWLDDIHASKSMKNRIPPNTIVLIAFCSGIIFVNLTFVNSYIGTESKQTIQTISASLNAFQEDPYLCSKRLPYSSFKCERQISEGSFDEVWIGTLDDNSNPDNPSKRIAAIKKLLSTRSLITHELACFADEIRLVA